MFIRNNRRSRLVSALLGAVIVVIPTSVIILYLIYNMNIYKHKLSEYGRGESMTASVYMAKSDMVKGEKVSASNVKKVNFCIPVGVTFPTCDDIDGMVMSQDIKAGSIITKSMGHDDEGIRDDFRLHGFTGIDIGSGVNVGNYIDIRIAMPDGEDFIVAAHKEVIGLNEGIVVVQVNEPEILKMSSVAVDVGKYEGARLYATMYAADYQSEAIPDYPANIEVCQLGNWDPNVIDKVFTIEVMDKRKNLESNLLQYIKG